MRFHPLGVSIAAITSLAACSGGAREPALDSTATATVVAPDTATAMTLRDSAKATLATLLQDPATATFDSVVVIQPPHDGERLPAMAVCGRIGGRPGIGGRTTPVRFVYQSKWTVFVEEAGNQAAFGELWARSCAIPAGVVVLRE
jgi:hypothetical protein